ncbi:MFS transporter [Leptospira biflexa]|uniref:MFS transporter n=1 Tax=Leptospira biflexa TaxID=172 RepID=UPI0010912DA6|nr:MFS transporter [Leptospira biflexa]TGM41760.1 MFS transporter [Leptospira biflexa]TGM51928.1 MFS transporter [Leptospira biflexa]
MLNWLTRKPTILSSLIIALASMGDAFLYVSLPLHYSSFNVPIYWIGFLLSINRFIRLFSNGFLVYIFYKFNLKRITIIGASVAVFTTFAYSTSPIILYWIFSRTIWGITFSALRMVSSNYSFYSHRQSFSFGISKGIQELGPIFALIVGPRILSIFDVSFTFKIFAIIGGIGVILALLLPSGKVVTKSERQNRRLFLKRIVFLPSYINQMTFITSFVVQGILAGSLSILLSKYSTSILDLTLLTGYLLAIRRVSIVIISPFGGLLSERFGIANVNFISIFITTFACFLIYFGFEFLGILLAFLSNSVTAALSPAHNAMNSDHPLKSMATNNTWSDFGGALGILLGGFPIFVKYVNELFFVYGLIVLIISFVFIFRRMYVEKSRAYPIV